MSLVDQAGEDPSRPAPSGVDGRGATRAALWAAFALTVGLHLALSRWWIEDAAITFSYARNVANGDGLVPWPGGERIEGYSDPTWMVLLAAAYAIGVSPWLASKVLGAAFACGAVWKTWRIAQRASEEADAPATWLAPLVLAGSAQFAIWGASGLENALVGFLLAGGVLATLREIDGARRPVSALWFLALVWTRPEGAMYAVVALCWLILGRLRDQRPWGGVIGWLAVVVVPSALLEAARIAYFAWPLPNTYYAKMEVNDGELVRWYLRGWSQLRAWAGFGNPQRTGLPSGPGLWVGFLLPVYLAGVLGLRGWRGRAVAVCCAVVAAALAWPGPAWLIDTGLWPTLADPPVWMTTRIALLGALAAGLPLVGLGASGLGVWAPARPAPVARGLVAHMAVAGCVFAIHSGGDWMRGFRWFSNVAPMLAVVFAVGVGEVAAWFEGGRSTGWGQRGWSVVALLVGLTGAANLNHFVWFRTFPEMAPRVIKLRADYTTRVARRAFFDEEVVTADMDMGAHLWWSDQRMLDVASLVDIPIARHDFTMRPFVEEYFFRENTPTFFHAHGWWANTTNFDSYPGWSDIFALLPYADPDEPGGQHEGMWMNRRVFMEPTWTGTARPIAFEGGRSIPGFDVPSPEAAAGHAVFVEVGMSLAAPAADNVRWIAFLANGERVVAWDLPAGYNWLSTGDWRPGEVFHGRFGLPLPGKLPPGAYDLGFVLLGPDGAVLAPASVPDGAVLGTPGDARYALGEVRFPDVVTVVRPTEIGAYVEADRQAAFAHAAAGRCAEAERSWVLARRHLPYDERLRAQPPRADFAACWARSAASLTGAAQVDALARAHHWDHRSPALTEIGGPVAERLYQEGLAARASQDWQQAFDRFSAALRIEPFRAWARRYAEEARDHRLGLHDREKTPWVKPRGGAGAKAKAKAP